MLNDKAEPYILEINHTPSFSTDTPLDYFIKFNYFYQASIKFISTSLTVSFVVHGSVYQYTNKINLISDMVSHSLTSNCVYNFLQYHLAICYIEIQVVTL